MSSVSEPAPDRSLSLSIIVVSYNAAATIERCLSALVAQRADSDEIIVVDSGEDETARIVAEKFPDVKLIRCEGRRYPGAARNIGIENARGELIGFVDSDCVAAPDWIARVLSAHREPDPVIGGVVDNASPGGLLGWAIYFCEFHQWMPGTPAGSMVEIPTCCLSVKRWALDRFGPFRSEGYCSDTAFNWKLGRSGNAPRFDPSIRVFQIYDPTLAFFVRKQLMHGRAFARMRVAEQGFSTARRLLYAALSPVLPFILSLRLMRRVLSRGVYRAQLLASAPLVFAGLCLWSLGELSGYAASPDPKTLAGTPTAAPGA
jgi:glycosyltransferase involved in cell wall biosynthesis